MKQTIGFFAGIMIIFSLIHWSGMYTDTLDKAFTKKGWNKPFLTEILKDDTAIAFIQDKAKI